MVGLPCSRDPTSPQRPGSSRTPWAWQAACHGAVSLVALRDPAIARTLGVGRLPAVDPGLEHQQVSNGNLNVFETSFDESAIHVAKHLHPANWHFLTQFCFVGKSLTRSSNE